MICFACALGMVGWNRGGFLCCRVVLGCRCVADLSCQQYMFVCELTFSRGFDAGSECGVRWCVLFGGMLLSSCFIASWVGLGGQGFFRLRFGMCRGWLVSQIVITISNLQMCW